MLGLRSSHWHLTLNNSRNVPIKLKRGLKRIIFKPRDIPLLASEAGISIPDRTMTWCAIDLSEHGGWSAVGWGKGAGGGGVGGAGDGALLTDDGGELETPAELMLLCIAWGDSSVGCCKEPVELLLVSWMLSPLLTGKIPPFSVTWAETFHLVHYF